MKVNINKYLPPLLVGAMALIFSIYFSLFTINRYEKLYSHYFDLGIMNQTAHNTYKGITTLDFSRVLELSDPHETPLQVKRMSIHNDVLIGIIALFYFIHSGPETLLVVQTLSAALGGIIVYLIASQALLNVKGKRYISVLFSLAYFLYTPLQKTISFDFHAVAIATTLFLAMFYMWNLGKYRWSILFAFLGALSKEQAGLMGFMWALFVLLKEAKFDIRQIYYLNFYKSIIKKKEIKYALTLGLVSIFWVGLSMFIIIPYFRGGAHFATGYYDHLKENPVSIFTYLFSYESFKYLFKLTIPLFGISFFAPEYLFITLPDILINILSSNENMRNIYFHYDALITPWIFIAGIYGIKRISKWVPEGFILPIMLIVIMTSITNLYYTGSLPGLRQQDIYPWKIPKPIYEDVLIWKKNLENDAIKVSTTGRIAPHFTSRRYFYDFSPIKYPMAEYVLIEKGDALRGYLKKQTVPAYNMIQNDTKYIKIYDRNGLLVYKHY